MAVAEADRADEAAITKKQTNTMLGFITLRLAKNRSQREPVASSKYQARRGLPVKIVCRCLNG